MNNSIYISNTQIQIIGYAPSRGTNVAVQKYASVDLPEQVIINGMVMDSAALTEKLGRLYNENPSMFANATLTIDTNAILTKMIPVPILRKEQYQELATRELASSSGAYDELIYDYDLMVDKKDRNILACAINKPILESYLSIFRDLRIKLNAIYIGLDLVVHFVRNTPSLSDKRMVLNILDGFSLLSVIFDNGKYVFSNRTRIMADTEEEFATRVIQSLTSLAQFNKTFNTSYYVGATPRLIELMRQLKPGHLEVDIAGIDLLQGAASGQIKDQCHFAYLGACAPSDCVNLIDTYQRSNKKPSAVRVTPFHWVGIGLLVVALGVFGFIKFRQAELEKDTQAMRDFVSNPENIEMLNYVEQKNKEIAFYTNDVVKGLNAARNVFEATPQFTKKVYDFIYEQCQGRITIKSLSYDATRTKVVDGTNKADPIITLSCYGVTAEDTTLYVKRLLEYEDFETIENPRYQETSQGFEFGLTIHLKVTEKQAIDITSDDAVADDTTTEEGVQP